MMFPIQYFISITMTFPNQTEGMFKYILMIRVNMKEYINEMERSNKYWGSGTHVGPTQ